ncbi:MAG: ExeA family protein [Aquabacterium sp.]
MTTNPNIRRLFDPTQPPRGVRLQVANVCADLGVSMADLAAAAGISKTSMFRLVTDNEWPARTDAAAIRGGVERLLAERGAPAEAVAGLWHAHVTRSRRLPAATHPNPPAAPAVPPAPQETDVLLPKQSLSMAARKAFGLFVNPFDAEVTSEESMFVNAEIAFVREACWQAAVGGRFVAVVSESGGGKTTIVQDLEARIARDRKQVMVIRPSVLGMEDSDSKGAKLKATDILAAIITTLDPLATVPQTLEARSRRAARALSTSMEAGFLHLLVIEEAHCLPDATLKHLKRLHELHLGRRPMLGILLVAQPELMLKLDPRRAGLREVTQRCEVVQLLPLDADLKAYLEHRMVATGKALATVMDDAAVEELRARLTVQRGGTVAAQARAVSLLYPLAVNNLVTAALNTAAELGVPVVNRDVVRAV